MLKSNWNYPTSIWVGENRIRDLSLACKDLNIKKPLLVTDKGLGQSAIVKNTLSHLKRNNLLVELFDDVISNPTGRNVSDGVKHYKQKNCDGVIAFGGGSGLDVGKAIAFMIGQTLSLWDFEDLGDNWTKADTNKIASIIAVPTTAGTGSETGRASVILDEIEEQKKRAKQKKIPYIYNRKWRDKNESDAPKEINPVIRFKSKVEGKSILKDLVQGNIEIENNTIEDFVILRADGSPTYNLSASVDDHLMGMTHIIRGDDHKINTFKQIQIYESMNWEIPSFAHIPLIHTIEGKKLSKRDNASTLDDYSKIGIMPNALRNYLLRLGWSFEDKEIFDLEESIKYFNLDGIGKSPSKLDISRIYSMNEHYIKNLDENNLFKFLKNYCETFKEKIPDQKEDKIKDSLHFLKNKAKTLEDIYNNSKFLINDEIQINDEDKKLLDKTAIKIISLFIDEIKVFSSFSRENLEPIINKLIKNNNTNFKGVGQPLRICLTGSKFGPGIYDILCSLGKEEVYKRLSQIR